MSDSSEPTPAVLHLAEDSRRRLGTLDPQQVAIWRQMTPARKLQLLFQLCSFGLKVAWTTERQWHPQQTCEGLTEFPMMLCGDIAQRSFWETTTLQRMAGGEKIRSFLNSMYCWLAPKPIEFSRFSRRIWRSGGSR